MSLMTSGVKMPLCPRTFVLLFVVSSAMAIPPSENELALGRLEIVVVVELLATHELVEARWRAKAVDAELALHVLGVGVRPLTGDAVDAERLDLAADVDDAVVHGVAQARARVAADDLAAALHHEAGVRADRSDRQDQPALLVDARAGARAALDHEVAAADGGARDRAGIALDHDDAGHHVLARRPSDPALDVDLGAVDEAASEVAEAAFVRDLAALQDADADRVLGPGVLHGHVGDAALVQQVAQLEVDLAGREVLRVEDGLAAADLGDAGDGVVRLDQPTGVVDDSPLAD